MKNLSILILTEIHEYKNRMWFEAGNCVTYQARSSIRNLLITSLRLQIRAGVPNESDVVEEINRASK